MAAAAAGVLSGCSGAGTVAGAESWLAALALLLVAALAYLLGHARARLQRPPPAATAPQASARAATELRALDGPAPADFGTALPADDRGAFLRELPALPSEMAEAPDAPIAAPAVGPAALSALLALQPGAAVLALQDPDGRWQAVQANDAARAQWPGVAWPSPLSDLMTRLPATAAAAVRAAMESQVAPSKAAAAGWQIERFDAGLVLAQPPAGGSGAGEGDTFSFTASHDLRAPIRVVEGFTRIVKEDYGALLDKVGNDHLDRVLGAAARMNLMIDALLTLARLSQQPLARQPVNLSQLAGFIVDDLRRGDPGREADVEIDPDLAAMGDPTLLRLVLENLLGNAWKYSANTARAQISLRAVPHEGGIAYVVRDNGAGFDMRSADRLFGLFQRLHSASEFAGHGVGLASVKRIVNRHGGEIWAEAEPGRGAAFFFTLAP